MKKFIGLSVLFVAMFVFTTQISGCEWLDETASNVQDAIDPEEKPLSVSLYTDMYLNVDQTCSVKGYRTVAKGEICFAFKYAQLVVVRSNDNYHLLRYKQRKDVVEQDPDSSRDFCSPGTLFVMSKEDFKTLDRIYEKQLEEDAEEQRRQQAAEELLQKK